MIFSKKDIISLFGIILFTILNTYINNSLGINEFIFSGIKYNPTYIALFINIANYILIALFIHTLAEYYFKEYGSIILIRKVTRSNIFIFICSKIIQKVFIIFICSLLTYIVIQFIILKSTFSLSLYFIIILAIYFLGLIISSTIQFILELKLNSTVGLLITILLYSLQLIVGDFIIRVDLLRNIQIFLPVNYLNYIRIESFFQSIGYSLIMIITLIIIMTVLKKVIKKIDII